MKRLHDIPARSPDNFWAAPGNWDQVFRNVLTQAGRQPVYVGGGPGVEFIAALRGQDVLDRLAEQWAFFEVRGIRPEDLSKAAFVITYEEWQAIRRMDWYDLRLEGFPVEEGVELRYRGYPLVILDGLRGRW